MENKQIVEEITRTINMESESLKALPTTVDMGKAAEIVHQIGNCKGRILIAGCGTSAMAAKKIVHSLNCIERPALFLTPSDAVHGGLGSLQKEDILILVSKGGNTAELVQLMEPCRKKGAFLIGVSENEMSAIAKESDLFLKIKIDREPCRFNMLATASTLSVIAVFDGICIALMQYTNYTKEQFAVIHPKGAVGERLLKKEE